MDFSSWAFKNKNLVYFLIAILICGGLLAAWQMSKLEDPEVNEDKYNERPISP